MVDLTPTGPHRLGGSMRIYTRTGDDGTTGLFGGARVEKDDARVEAFGTVDELNSVIGAARAAGLSDDVDQSLGRIQDELFHLGAELACVSGKESKLGIPLLNSDSVARLERTIDLAEADLAPLTQFLLPGGSPGAALLHLARTVCRRAERRVLAASRLSPVSPVVFVYLNRLADLLFVLARRANHAAGLADVKWTPRIPEKLD